MARAHFQVLAIPFRLTSTPGYEFAIFKRSDLDCWQGIAGGGEDTETPLQAMKREALEEAGIPKNAKYYRLKTFASIPVYCFGASKYWPKDLLRYDSNRTALWEIRERLTNDDLK